MSAKHSSV